MLTDEHVVKTQLVGQDHRFPVLAQSLGVVATQRVHGHHEQAKAHGGIPI